MDEQSYEGWRWEKVAPQVRQEDGSFRDAPEMAEWELRPPLGTEVALPRREWLVRVRPSDSALCVTRRMKYMDMGDVRGWVMVPDRAIPLADLPNDDFGPLDLEAFGIALGGSAAR